MNNAKIGKAKAALRIIFVVLLFVLIIYAVLEFIPDIIDLLKTGDEAAMEAYIAETGRFGIVIIVVLQVLQTITIIFPGIPIYMCSGIVFGKIKGTLICYLTYVVSNVAVFIFSKRLGEAADMLVDNKKELAVARLMKKTKHPLRFVIALCVVPIVPNGIIPHLAAQSKITLKQFFTAVAVGCLPGIILFVCCGDLILDGYLGPIAIAFVICVIIAIIAYIFKDKVSILINKLLELFSGEDSE